MSSIRVKTHVVHVEIRGKKESIIEDESLNAVELADCVNGRGGEKVSVKGQQAGQKISQQVGRDGQSSYALAIFKIGLKLVR